jgi:sulfate adenylyltransferase
MIEPHGNVLINTINPEMDISDIKLQIEIDGFTLALLECIANGTFSPLDGFMGKQDYESVVYNMRLKNGTIWPIPITCAIEKNILGELHEGDTAKLLYEGKVYGVIKINDIYEVDLEVEAEKVYQTTDINHPGVKRIFQKSGINIGGKVTMINRPPRKVNEHYYLDPIEVRKIIEEKGWKSIVAFQTRNPIHRAHEYIQKTALEMVDGLLIHPLVGETKKDDIPQSVRMKSYERLVDSYYVKERTMLAAFPAPMHYAGPREALLHAIARKNYGCTHFIVGRDHAGVGSYYGTYDAQLLLKTFKEEELGIIPICFDHSFYCLLCETMATAKTCPHSEENHLILSGTKVREMLRNGEKPPKEFSRSEVVDVLIEGLRGVES